MLRGEIYQAIKAGSVKKDKVVELGNVIAGSAKGRTSQKQLSVADLTGVAVQDIKIASAVYKEVKNM
jgi:ornithine cyclodeaminase